MKILFTLLRLDLLAIFHWFREEKLSKVIVLLGFLFVGTGFSIFLFLVSRYFFQSLYSYESYGLATAYYLLHAAVILVLWFAIGSSITATVTFLLTPNLSHDFLLTLPIPSHNFTIWYFIRSSIMNIILLTFILFPLTSSFTVTFIGGLSYFFLLRLLFILSALVFISISIGGIIAYYVVGFIKGKEMYAAVLGGLSFLFICFLLLQLIFPESLSKLYNASPSEFDSLYQSLPLVSIPIPTRWFADTLVSGFGMSSLFLVFIIIILTILVLVIQSIKIIKVMQDLKGRAYKDIGVKKFLVTKSDISGSQYPLIIKDWYSLRRTSSEVGYAVFLLSLLVFFFLFLWRATGLREINPKYTNEIIIFSFVWLMFFTVCYLLRLVFPLMAREGQTYWYIFSQPISREKIMQEKLILGSLLCLPIVGFSGVLWLFLPYAAEHVLFLEILSVVSIVLLAFAHGILGSIFPNFSKGCNPEKVSTSIMGITALLTSVAVISGICYLLSQVIEGNLARYIAIGSVTLGGTIFVFILYIIAKHYLSHHNYT